MRGKARSFELPKIIDRLLGSLSKLYANEGKRSLQEIIVNASIRVQEEWSADSWNGGTYGHALYLTVPEHIFIGLVKQKGDIQSQIKDDLNNVHNVQNEFIEEVFLELEIGEGQDWRGDSGLLLSGKRVVSADATKRIWKEGQFRVFLSHKSEVKKDTSSLKDQLALFGISAFVAHADINPTKAWQDEIENALASMDSFVALMTAGFHDSNWTDQEVGYAVVRGIPLIAVRLGMDPYGFIGKFQGLSCSWPSAAAEISKVLIKNDRMFSAYVRALRECPNWDSGNTLAKALPGIDRLNRAQIDDLVAVYNDAYELRGSFGFNGLNPRYYGEGLVFHVNRLGPVKYGYVDDRLIGRVST